MHRVQVVCEKEKCVQRHKGRKGGKAKQNEWYQREEVGINSSVGSTRSMKVGCVKLQRAC